MAGQQLLWDRRGILAILSAVALILAPPAGALESGDLAPEFRLPWLSGDGGAEAPALFEDGSLTALVFWNHGCPRCTEIALHVGDLADSLRPLGAGTICILFGPDDPVALRNLLRDRGVSIPHLWDESGSVAAAYGLGSRHLGTFLIDRRGLVRAVFDDEVPDLVTPVVPAARRLLSAPPPSSPAAEGVSAEPPARKRTLPHALSALRLDLRVQVQSTDGVREGGIAPDRGLYGETLENGRFGLWRLQLRYSWSPLPGVEFEPWLRLGNETDEVLAQGPERLTSRWATASLRLRRGAAAATIGAFPLRVSPLLLQRWDSQDAPPLGGVSSCGCGPGGSALSQRSLEVLTPYYTFEGFSASATHRYGRVRGWIAVPRWEEQAAVDAPLAERLDSHYRRTLRGAAIDLGATAMEDPRSGLPSPVGLRAAVVGIGDDAGSLPRDLGTWRPEERDETGWVVQTSLGPWLGVGAEAEHVWWDLRRSPAGANTGSTPVERTVARAWRAGLRGEWAVKGVFSGPWSLWGEAYRIHTGDGFEPLYRALTYDPNREGWRLSAGLRLLPAPRAARERLGLTAFYRPMRESKEVDFAGAGRVRSSAASLTLLGRPLRGLLAEAHLVRLRIDYPVTTVPGTETRGISIDLRLERWAGLDPFLRVDGLQERSGSGERHTIRQWVLSLRALR